MTKKKGRLMQKILHITGGKVISEKLRKINSKYEIVTWNEMLSEGKTTTDVGSEHFWKNRYDFFKTEYNTGKASFIDNMLKEYRNLCNYKTQDEAILWFDSDLQSQINMIAVLSWLEKYRKDIQVSWVKSEKPLSQLSVKETKIVYENRILLTEDDVEYGDYIWQLYCSETPLQLEKYTKKTDTNLTSLPKTLELHLKRYPSVTNGLNQIENTILQSASSFKGDKQAFVAQCVESQKDLGFYELQYENVLTRLKSLFSSLNTLKINKKGKEVLQGSVNMYPILRNEKDYLGGSLKYDFLYYGVSGKILKL